MKKRISTTIEAGDIVCHGKRLWVASGWDKTRPCCVQCAMCGDDGCRGYCFRWDNTEDVVFKDIPDGVTVDDVAEIVETPDLIGKRLREAKAKTKGWGQGCVTMVYGQFRADFYMDGNRYWYTSSDIAEVEAWLAAMNKKKSALKELERMKKS